MRLEQLCEVDRCLVAESEASHLVGCQFDDMVGALNLGDDLVANLPRGWLLADQGVERGGGYARANV